MAKHDSTKKTDKPTPNPVGRPDAFTQQLADRVCEELALGKSLRRVCDMDGMPAPNTVFKWMRTREEFLQQYARAKQESADAMAEELLDIVDDARNDYMEDNYDKGRTPGYTLNGENIQRSKLRSDTRKWLMAKMKPKVYGDKVDITSGGEKLPTPIMGGAALLPRESADK